MSWILYAFLIAMNALASLASPHHKIGYVNVSVATLWTDSSKPRPVDTPALTNPAHIEEWLDSMTVKQFRGLTSGDRTQTQALYGSHVVVLNKSDGWYEIAVPSQPTPKNTLGYPGWVPEAQLAFDAIYGQTQSSRPFAQVTKATTALYSDAEMTEKIMHITYDTRLPVINTFGQVVQVAVPENDKAYLATSDIHVYSHASEIPYPDGNDLVETAKMFLDRPYLWGGTSGFAFDCSGFTHTLYHGHGITIPRDADAQAQYTSSSKRVSRDDLQPGDLIYYATNLTDANTIYHVAMYTGHGNMTEAYGAGVPVRITPVRFNDDYWGAERILTQ